jgi:hypothetical protein
MFLIINEKTVMFLHINLEETVDADGRKLIIGGVS